MRLARGRRGADAGVRRRRGRQPTSTPGASFPQASLLSAIRSVVRNLHRAMGSLVILDSMQRAIFAWAVRLVIIVMVAARAVSAGTFAVESSREIALDPAVADQQVHVLLTSSTTVTVEVSVIMIAGGTSAIPPTAVQVPKDKIQVTALGVPLPLTIHTAAFERGGDYTVYLALAGAGVSERAAIPLRMALAPRIIPDPAPPMTLSIERASPLTIARHAGRVVVVNPLNRAISVTLDKAPVVDGSNEDHGVITWKATAPLTVAAASPGVVDVEVSVDKVGRFTATMLAQSSAFERPERVPVTIVVRDDWYFPLLTILIGVGLAAGMVALVRRVRPALDNAYHAERMLRRIERTLPTVADLVYRADLEKLRVEIEDALSLLDPTDVHARLEECEQELRKSDMRFSEALATARADYETAKERLAAATRGAGEVGQIYLVPLEDELRKVEVPLRAGDLRAAQSALRSVLGKLPVAKSGETPKTTIVVSPSAPRAGLPAMVSLTGLAGGEKVEWTIAGKTPDVKREADPRIEYTFPRGGRYRISAGVQHIEIATLDIVVTPSRTEEMARIAKRERMVRFAVLAIAAFIATFSAMQILYVDKPFGTFGDYLAAFVWGFGVDAGVKGFAGTVAVLAAGSQRAA